ncbi:MAG TPA: ABC transporter permease [Symbiobacteriaceae bacterium]|nr:ABC transporter permease [Symbiobacteriaceae bacterium]
MKAFSALYAATAREFLRDKMAILFTLLLPLIMAAFFGLIFRGGDITQAMSYVPGMLALGFLWLGVFGVAPPLVQMREQQILRRLGATPLRRSTLMAAQVAWRLTVGLIQAALLITYGFAVYHMVIPAGQWLPLVGAILLGGAVLVSLGFLLASLAKSNESVVGLGQVVQFPMMFLSGILFPMEMLPSFLRPAVNAMPVTYLGDALRQTMLGTPGLFALWVDFAVLAGCLVLFSGLSVRFFRWE